MLILRHCLVVRVVAGLSLVLVSCAGLSLIKSMVNKLEFRREECRKSPTLLAVHFHAGADSAMSVCTSSVALDDDDDALLVASPHSVMQGSLFMVIVFADAAVEVPKHKGI